MLQILEEARAARPGAMKHLLFSALGALLLAGCSQGVAPDAGRPGCTPGTSIACSCTSGESGTQSCRTDRTYEACICASSVDAGMADAPSDAPDVPEVPDAADVPTADVSTADVTRVDALPGVHLVSGGIGTVGPATLRGGTLQIVDEGFERGARVCAGSLCATGALEP